MSEFDTGIGGKSYFDRTDWGEIERLQTQTPEHRRAVLNRLSLTYWKPIYCYVRRKGFDHHDAKELTQSFFVEIVLEKDLFGKADKKIGKFRTFLLCALGNFIRNQLEENNAKKRKPQKGLVSLEVVDADLPQSAAETPEQAYDLEWARMMVNTAMGRVERECAASGQNIHWQVFRTLTIMTTLDGAKAPSLRQLCDELGIPDTNVASSMNVVIKRKYKRLLRQTIQNLEFPHRKAGEEEIDEVIKEIIQLAGKGGAGSEEVPCT